MMSHYLSLLVFFPLIGAVLILFMPKEQTGVIRKFATAVAAIELLLSIPLLMTLIHPIMPQIVPEIGLSQQSGLHFYFVEHNADGLICVHRRYINICGVGDKIVHVGVRSVR